ncbi:MAG: hypothetical protein LBH73_02535 [Spirochaetaceae bacterium]|jgi:hypothetical protein|nr:hypothetical protein [Spirochaetaceae bacterium]
MKKLIVAFMLLIILAGVCLVFGWVQRSVPPGSYGVLRSKTHGIDSRLIQEGEFRWVWYALIPTNAKVSVFSLDTLTKEVSVQGSLPSGEVLASLEGISLDFSYEVKGSFSFNIKPDSLIALMTGQSIGDQAALDNFEARTAGEIEAFAIQRLRFYAGEEASMAAIAQGDVSLVKADIERAFPYIDNFSLLISSVRFPDYALYRSMRSLYDEYLALQKGTLRADALAENRIKNQLHFEELTHYGELLTKYPVLLKYLAIERGSDTLLNTILTENSGQENQ